MVGNVEGLEKCIRHYIAHDNDGINMTNIIGNQIYYICKYNCDGQQYEKSCWHPLFRCQDSKYWNIQLDEFFLKNNIITEKEFNDKYK